MLDDSKVKESAEDIARMIGPSKASLSATPTSALTQSARVSPATSSKNHIQPPKLRFIKQIRAHQLLSRARSARPKVVQDYVSEERLPKHDPRNSFLGLFPYPDIFRTIRPLKPKRINVGRELERGGGIGSGESGCKLSIQVLRGFNIPVRSNGSKKERGIDGSKKELKPPVLNRNLTASIEGAKLRRSYIPAKKSQNYNSRRPESKLEPNTRSRRPTPQNIRFKNDSAWNHTRGHRRGRTRWRTTLL
jgi:hypothetical protein